MTVSGRFASVQGNPGNLMGVCMSNQAQAPAYVQYHLAGCADLIPMTWVRTLASAAYLLAQCQGLACGGSPWLETLL